MARQRHPDRPVGRAVYGEPRRGQREHRRGSRAASRSGGRPQPARGSRTPDRWFDTSTFTLPAQYAFGTAPRNSVIGPGAATVDLAVAKTWGFQGSKQLEFRWEIFNLLNRTNFDLPSRTFGTPNFGRIFSAKNAREMQFGLKFMF